LDNDELAAKKNNGRSNRNKSEKEKLRKQVEASGLRDKFDEMVG
jgi:hypothetical protein